MRIFCDNCGRRVHTDDIVLPDDTLLCRNCFRQLHPFMYHCREAIGIGLLVALVIVLWYITKG